MVWTLAESDVFILMKMAVHPISSEVVTVVSFHHRKNAEE